MVQASDTAQTWDANVIWQRHGRHDGHLTPAGIRDVQVGADSIPSSTIFQLAYHSGMPRARETAEVALALLDQMENVGTIIHAPLTGYEIIEKTEATLGTYESLLAAIATEKAAQRPITLPFVFSHYPVARILGAMHLAWMEHVVRQIIADRPDLHTDTGTNIYVGGHGTATYAAPDIDAMTGDLEPGGIVKFHFQIADQAITLESATHLTAEKS